MSKIVSSSLARLNGGRDLKLGMTLRLRTEYGHGLLDVSVVFNTLTSSVSMCLVNRDTQGMSSVPLSIEAYMLICKLMRDLPEAYTYWMEQSSPRHVDTYYWYSSDGGCVGQSTASSVFSPSQTLIAFEQSHVGHNIMDPMVSIVCSHLLRSPKVADAYIQRPKPPQVSLL